MRKEYEYDPKHFYRVPAPGHGRGTRGGYCKPCSESKNSGHYGSYRKGTSAEGAWRVSVGLPVK